MSAIKKALFHAPMCYLLFSCVVLILALSFSYPAQAVETITLTKKQMQQVADFDLQYKASAGGTITKDYFVFPENKSGHGGIINITVVNRKTCKIVDKIVTKVGHISGLYNKWGSDYITLIGKALVGEKERADMQIGCYRLVGARLERASGCPTPPPRHLSYQGTGQGNTATFDGYTFKVAGYKGGKIGLWDRSGNQVLVATVPETVVKYEPENISVDGATGEVYINYARHMSDGKKRSVWYKIDSSVFAQYTGKNKTSHPTTCRNENATNSIRNTTSNETKSTPSKQSATTNETKSTPSKQSATTNETKTTPSKQSTTTGSTSEATSASSNSSNSSNSIADKKTCGGAETILLSCGEDGTEHILLLIIDIFSFGVGILGVISIVLAGIQYLTSGSDVVKSTKAKHRIGQIVLGIVIYTILWSLTHWLLP